MLIYVFFCSAVFTNILCVFEFSVIFSYFLLLSSGIFIKILLFHFSHNTLTGQKNSQTNFDKKKKKVFVTLKKCIELALTQPGI